MADLVLGRRIVVNNTIDCEAATRKNCKVFPCGHCIGQHGKISSPYNGNGFVQIIFDNNKDCSLLPGEIALIKDKVFPNNNWDPPNEQVVLEDEFPEEI